MQNSNPYEFLAVGTTSKRIREATRAVDAQLKELRKEYEKMRDKHGVYKARCAITEKALRCLEPFEDIGGSDSEPRRAVRDKVESWDAIELNIVDACGYSVRNFQFDLIRALLETGKISIGSIGHVVYEDNKKTTVVVCGHTVAEFMGGEMFEAIDVLVGSYIDIEKGYCRY